MNLKDLILNTPDLTDLKPVEVKSWPETKGQLFLRQMTAKEKEQYELQLQSYLDKKQTNLKATVICSVLVDKDGKRIFTNSDSEKLADKSAEAIDYLFDQWIEWSNLLKNSEVDLKKD